MKRSAFNENMLTRCSRYLQSKDPSEVYEGVVLAAYLVEQSFKCELREISPLLYVDRTNIPEEMEMRIALNKTSPGERGSLNTIKAKRAVAQMCIYDSELKSHKSLLEELFTMRNGILHSVEDLLIDDNSVAQTAVSALRVCRTYVGRYAGVTATHVNPLTSKEFEQLEEDKRKKRIGALRNMLEEHRAKYGKLNQEEVSKRLKTNLPRTDECTWIEETAICPACDESSLDKVCSVEFDWNPDGMLASSGSQYQCRVCELELSEYEYRLIGDGSDS